MVVLGASHAVEEEEDGGVVGGGGGLEPVEVELVLVERREARSDPREWLQHQPHGVREDGAEDGLAVRARQEREGQELPVEGGAVAELDVVKCSDVGDCRGLDY